jgi:hypothetical protein
MDELFLGQYVIVRGKSSGVFAGVLEKRSGTEVQLSSSRRLWYWEGAFTLSALAKNGTSKPESCRFSCELDQQLVLDAVEVLPCDSQAKISFDSVPVWVP